MRREALEAPAAVARLLAHGADAIVRLAAEWAAAPPRALLTLARGSSDHAAQHFAYLAMARTGRLVTSLPPSLLTLHGARFDAAGFVALAFSQSGRSPDLVESVGALAGAGATTVAVVNDAASPLAAAAARTIALDAGPERSVAATKSFIAQLAAGAGLVAHWQAAAHHGEALRAAWLRLPDDLAAAARTGTPSADAALEPLTHADRMVVVGRGLGLALAHELALKFKETCGLQAEAFSGAELQHGPQALVGPGYPVLVLALRGPAQAGLLAQAAALRALGAHVLVAAPPGHRQADMTLPTAAHEDLDAVVAALPLYLAIETLARARGRDPDAPPHSSKVTLTR